MRRLTKTEKAAAAAVLGMAAGVAGSGIALLKRYSHYMAAKAAAAFDQEEAAEEISDDTEMKEQ